MSRSTCLKIVVLIHVTVATSLGLFIWAVFTDRYPARPEVPPHVEDVWFGMGNPVREDTAVKPYKVGVSEKVLTDLKHRVELDLARLQPALVDSAFTYGFNSAYLRKVADYWLKKYDWPKQEKELNKFPHFKTKIDGLDVHFVHVKPPAAAYKTKKVLPLLMVHGWPGSFYEFYKILPLLTTPSDDRDFVFEVVAPSIPGYGFSSAPTKKGFDAAQCAKIFKKLMKDRLLFDKFYLQGGDWGSLITTDIALLFPEYVSGLHVNMAISQAPSNYLKLMLASYLPSGWIIPKEDEAKILPASEKYIFLFRESGYLHIQGTKPDTVGTALSSSPLGLAAYILEKFSTWTHKNNPDAVDGNLTKRFTLDELLTNIMIYWIDNSITSSQRFYKENFSFKERDQQLERVPVRVPTGIAYAPQELFAHPPSFLKSRFDDIVSVTELTEGGHFAAFEVPEAMAKDIWQFVAIVEAQKVRSAKSEL